MKEIVTLVMGDSAMSFEVEKRKPIKKREMRLVKEDLNLEAISINAEEMTRKFCLTFDANYSDIIKNPRLYRKRSFRKESAYISR